MKALTSTLKTRSLVLICNCCILLSSTSLFVGASCTSDASCGVAGSLGLGRRWTGILKALENSFRAHKDNLNMVKKDLEDYCSALDSIKGANVLDSLPRSPPVEMSAKFAELRNKHVKGILDELDRNNEDNAISSVTPGPDGTSSPPDLVNAKISRLTQVARADPVRLTKHTTMTSMEDIVVPDVHYEKPVEEIVCFLDIDKCSIYGQDGNDLAIAMQWMQKPFPVLVELYRRLLNPRLKQLFAQLRMTVKRLPVVLYTMRPQLLQYRSACRDERFALRWKTEWHHSVDQVLIPTDITDPAEILAEYSGSVCLWEPEKQDLYMSFQRLLAIRKVIEEELELDSVPELVVTSVMKDVQGTAIKLGHRPEKCYLWDDNQVLEGQPHVLTVEPFVAMDPRGKSSLLEFLREELPEHELTEEVAEFMIGAKPEMRSLIESESSNGFQYLVHECNEINRFPIPDLPVYYTRPRYTEMQTFREAMREKDANKEGGYNSAIIEFWTPRGVLERDEQMEALHQWKERVEMIW
mmetsp:Transcript_16061/g.36709  ORF Transcript_16061/g.36709 Transcript_16061/m.36709 type:complete len:524 (-) Transcript_16061:71-1642(-)